MVRNNTPEFSFNRLAYSESPEFGGRGFFPRQGWGWGTVYPGGDCKFLGGIHRLTGRRVDPNPNVIAINNENPRARPTALD